jgi:hypothetical protein
VRAPAPPDAVLVADRWHLFHNLGEAVDKTVAAHHACIPAHAASAADATAGDPAPVPPVDDPPLASEPDGVRDACSRERTLVARTRDRFSAVKRLIAAGYSLGAISTELDLDRSTVRRFARASTLDELLVKATNRTSVLDGHTEHLLTQFAAGVTDTHPLHDELRQHGYTGSIQTIRRYLHPLRDPTAYSAELAPTRADDDLGKRKVPLTSTAAPPWALLRWEICGQVWPAERGVRSLERVL